MPVFSKEQATIIQTIRKHGKITLPKLTQELGLHRSSLYYQLQGLTKQGILRESKVSARKTFYSIADGTQLKTFIETEQKRLTQLLLESPRVTVQGKKPRLVFCDSYQMQPDQLEALQKLYEVVTYDSPVRISPEAFVLRCRDADVVVTFFSVDVTRDMLLQCPNLKVIVTASVSREMIDEEACDELGIRVYSLEVHDYYKKAARTEFVFASLFNLLRPIYEPAQALKLGRFEHRGINAQELKGKIVGVVGVKREGKEIIPLLRAFGCGVEVHDPDKTGLPPSNLGIASFVSLKELFNTCDIIIFPEDYNADINLDARYVRPDMKTKYLLVLSYSVRLDIELLRARIIDRTISGLAIDYFADSVSVYDTFPTSDYRKIMNFPNVVVTPEIGFYSKEAMQRNNKEVMDILQNLDIGATA